MTRFDDSQWRKLSARLLLLIASAALALLLAEGAARLAWSERPHPSEPAADLPVLRTVRELNRPDVRGVHKRAYFRTNSAGLRGPEYSREPAKGTFRIAVIGDSVTMGSGVDEADTYVAKLPLLLSKHGANPDYEALNVGLAGINIQHAIDRLEAAAEHYRFDLVVYGFTINDIEGPHYEKVASSDAWSRYWTEAFRHEQSRSYLLRSVWPRWIALKERIQPTLDERFRERFFNYFENDAAWQFLLEELDRFAGFARERDICAHVLVHTHLTELGAQHPLLPIYERVAEAARDRGLSVTQSYPFFDGVWPPDLWVNLLDPHPNADGHSIMARALATGLAELPDECWSTGRTDQVRTGSR
jgi:lysophospholipase L1-like esterase